MRSLLAGALVAVAARAAVAADGVFGAEGTLAFGYLGSATAEPLVAVGGVPSSAFAYEGDAREAILEAGATRFFSGGVRDDGVTPFGLLAFVSRASRVTATFRLAGGSRDSQGSSVGETIRVRSIFAADRTVRDGALSGLWHATPRVAVFARLGAGWLRETAATTSIEEPSFRGSVSTFGSRSRSIAGGLGLRAWFGADTAVSADATLGGEDFTRLSSTTTGDLSVRTEELTRSATNWSVGLEARRLFAARRWDVSLSGRTGSTRARVNEIAPFPRRYDEPRARARSVAGRVAFHPLRMLGIAAGIAWTASDATTGLSSRRPSQSDRTVTMSLGGEWFATPRAAASLALERERTTTLLPPDSPTFQKLVETAWRVTLAARLRP